MSVLAVSCALLAIPVDPLRLATATDDELLWLDLIVEDVNHRYEVERRRAGH